MKPRILKQVPLFVLATTAAFVGIAVADNKAEEVHLSQAIVTPDKTKFDVESLSNDSYSDITEKVENRLKVDVYAVVPFENQALYTVFTTKGAYTVDETVSIAFKGKVIEIATGKNIQGEHLDKVKDVIKNKIEQRNAIDVFTSRQPTTPNHPTANDNIVPPLGKLKSVVPRTTDLSPQAQALNSNEVHNAPLNKVVELSPEAFQALKKQTKPMERMKDLAKERTMQYPGAQHYAERQRQNELKKSAALASDATHDNNSDTASILNTLKNLPTDVRRKHGPKYAPQILTNIDDNQFVVFEPNDSVEFRGTLTVATDITCPYCKKLHSIVPNLTEQGVRVRYMPYPSSQIMNYEFPKGFTVDEYIARTKTEPLNQLGQLVAAGYCSEDRPTAFSELFARRSLSKWPSEVTSQCEGTIREFKILGDLLYGGDVPYMVWSNNTGGKSEIGTIKGILRSDRTIDDLLNRLES